MLDLVIEGGTVLDGTGAAGARADVGIRSDTIVAVGDVGREPATSRLNASGKVVAPGFIDMHSHSDWRLWGNPRAESKIRQGVTTEVVGNCGFSPAPVADARLADIRDFALARSPALDFRWRSFADYLAALDAGGAAVNLVPLVGHGAVRLAVMGYARRAPDAGERETMRGLVGAAMDEGAWGMSTGLIYAPGSYATTDELVELARVVGRRAGFYASHIRGEGATLRAALTEALRIGQEAALPVQVSHLKAAGRPNWGAVREALAMLDGARAEGLDVSADVYPYTASSTTLRTLLPDWALEGGLAAMTARLADPSTRARIRSELQATGDGQTLPDRVGWDNVMVVSCARRKDAEAKRLSEIAAARGLDPLDALFEILRDEDGGGYVILFQLDEQDVRTVLTHPAVMIGSDGAALAPYGEGSDTTPHPRSYGTFPRVLGEYAREQRVLSLPQAVHKMTGLPAARLRLRDRGVLRPGARADLVVFDARTVADQATYDRPHRYPVGIEQVIVNGRFVIKHGEHTGSLPGRILTPP